MFVVYLFLLWMLDVFETEVLTGEELHKSMLNITTEETVSRRFIFSRPSDRNN